MSEQSTLSVSKEMTVYDVPMDLIKSDPEFNCRGEIGLNDVVDIMQSYKQIGQQTPVTLRRLVNDPSGLEYLVLAGNRRFYAAKYSEWGTIKATIVENIDDATAYVINLSENVKRKDLTLMQEAKAISHLVALKWGRGKIARALNQSDGWVQVRMMALDLAQVDFVKTELDRNELNTQQVRELYTLKCQDRTEELASAVKLIKEKKERVTKQKMALAASAMVNPDDKVDRKTAEARKAKKRSQLEVQRLIDMLVDTFGTTLASRCLAWANGNINSVDLIQEIKAQAESRGKTFVPPQFNII